MRSYEKEEWYYGWVKHISMRVSYIFVVAVFACFSCTSLAFAQAGAGVEIKPSMIDEGADPGQVLRQDITLTNISNAEQTYYLISRDISGVTDSNTPIFADPGAEITGFELSSWLEYRTEPITLAPGASEMITITVNVPQDATPGSHFGGVFISVEPPKLREVGAGIGYEVGVIVSIRISGDAIESARIREFSSDRLIYGSPIVNFVTRVENPGNVLIRPVGPLEINNMFGRRVGVLTVNDSLGGVFPGATRAFNSKWEGEGLGFGRYQAIVGLLYGSPGSQTTVSATVSFWVLPLKVILPVLGIISLVILVTYLGIKLYVRRALDELATSGGRRVAVRARRDQGISRLMMVALSLLIVTSLFLIGLLVLFA